MCIQIHIKCFDENVFPTRTFTYIMQDPNEDICKKFVESLEKGLMDVSNILTTENDIIMKKNDKKDFEEADKCYTCEKEFTKKNHKVKDHCHITGKYRGAAQNECNLKMKTPKFVPVLFHNLEGYDSHLFVESLGLREGKIKCIPKTDEK